MHTPSARRSTARTRPRNRRALILAAAARRFHRYGYHRVSMADIAQDVGVTPGALYRHFRNKQELLSHVIDHSLEVLDNSLANRQAGDQPELLLSDLAELTVEHRELGVLWQRESRHLPEEQRLALREHVRTLAVRIGELLRQTRADISPADIDFLTWSTTGVLLSPSFYALDLPSDHTVAVLVTLSRAVWDSDIHTGQTQSVPYTNNRGITPVSRREVLLGAAIRLFNERGYHDVSMDDIGAAAGIVSASVYNHFTSKADLLITALSRGAAGLQLGLSHALAHASSPREALEMALRSYVELMIAHPELVGTLLTEVAHLPEEDKGQIVALEHSYVGEWLRLLGEANPALSEPESQMCVQAIFTMVNNVARTKHLRTRTHLVSDTVAVGQAILHAAISLGDSRPDTSSVVASR
ncbi:TetR/AcrR family transcriptional regulator [Phytoactinopolyspora limicola]|uniref:TetR/AcrR family transcriptional regulator n=1 Tax=Phytoactinopolyspora limicola TaxID=2715536 RepID=UPI001409518C|nr:TetR family transcriptional regulator [Phytoactinopolyspora limicola]